jgi:hypothetical protein
VTTMPRIVLLIARLMASLLSRITADESSSMR